MVLKKRILAVRYCLLLCVLYCAMGISSSTASEYIKIGWASSDITPVTPVLLRGQFYARFSERVLDPIGATTLAMESEGEEGTIRTVLISCDLISVPDYLRDHVRKLVVSRIPELVPTDIKLFATHTHTAPLMAEAESLEMYGLPFHWFTGGQEGLTPAQYTTFAAERIANAAVEAWQKRKPGGISFGLSKAVIGHNRLHVDKSGRSQIYGDPQSPMFSHVEGYEDHNLNLLYTWDKMGKLTGVIINAAVTAQVSGHLYEISADFWTETKALLREELEKDLFVLPQVSAAGDQSPWTTWDEREEVRMQKLMGFEKDGTGRRSIGRRKQIARLITDGVKAILPYMKENIEWNPLLKQRTEVVQISRRSLGEVKPGMLEDIRREVDELKKVFEQMLDDVKANPQKKKERHWYAEITTAHTRYTRAKSVDDRYKNVKTEDPYLPVEINVIRIGDMAMATNPFELYLDYGIRMKARSPAVQTFVVQLAGDGTYVPTQRSIDGGAYGAVPASTLLGPKGGDELVEKTLEMLHSLWP